MRETALWQWLRQGRRAFPAADLDLSRVENLVQSGMPDVEGCLNGSQFWIELKVVKGKNVLRAAFRPAQVPWMRRRWAAGGRTFALLQVDAGPKARRYLVAAPLLGQFVDAPFDEGHLLDAAINPPNILPEGVLRLAAYCGREVATRSRSETAPNT